MAPHSLWFLIKDPYSVKEKKTILKRIGTIRLRRETNRKRSEKVRAGRSKG